MNIFFVWIFVLFFYIILLSAQQLLSQWVTDKVRFDDDDGYDDLEAWRRARQNRLAATAGEREREIGRDKTIVGVK